MSTVLSTPRATVEAPVPETPRSVPRKTTANVSLWKMLVRSLLHRRARSLSALVALTVSAAIATALLTLYVDLDSKLHKEFRAFGANVTVTASDGTALPADALVQVRQAAGAEAIATPFAFAVAMTDRNTPVVVAGTDFDSARKMNSWWQTDAWPVTANDVLLGQRAANFIADEHEVKLTFNGVPLSLHGVGHLRTGGDEDSRVYLPLATMTKWTGASPTLIEVQVPGGSAQIQPVIDRMQHALPKLQVRAVRQLVEGESRIVDRTHALVFAAVLLISLTVGVSVLATLSASVLERRRDFALMKALGSREMQIVGFFLAEALTLSLVAAVVGYGIGCGAAWLIGTINFHTASLPHLSVLPIVFLLNLLIAGLAALFPARTLRTLQPAALLKGE